MISEKRKDTVSSRENALISARPEIISSPYHETYVLLNSFEGLCFIISQKKDRHLN